MATLKQDNKQHNNYGNTNTRQQTTQLLWQY